MKTGPGKISISPSRSSQAFGNQAAQKFAQTCPLALPSPLSCPFGGICHRCPSPVQAKLTVGQPGDKYEQEADRVAEEILRHPEPTAVTGPGSLEPRQSLPLMRSCAPCDEHLQRLTLEECEEPRCQKEEKRLPLLPKGVPGQTQQVAPAQEAAISGSLEGGSPLPGALRDFYEPRFGQDFSGVRLHTDAQAATAAQTVQARAFTLGSHIVLGAGEYAPETERGRKLLAHELTHVVQQTNTLAAPALQRWSWGTGAPIPHLRGGELIEVPEEHRPKVENALHWVEGIKDNSDHPCHRFFQNHCTRFQSDPLVQVFDTASVWFWDFAPPDRGGTSSRDIDAMAYTRLPYRLCVLPMAATFFHEMLHLCGVTSEELADEAKRSCGVPSLHMIGGGLVVY